MKEENVVLYDSESDIEKLGGSEIPVIIDVKPEPINTRATSLSPRIGPAVELVQKGIIVLEQVLRLASGIVKIKDNLQLAKSDTIKLQDTTAQTKTDYSTGSCGRQRRCRRHRGW